MENKQKLKGGEIEMEDLNRYNSIEEIEKEKVVLSEKIEDLSKKITAKDGEVRVLNARNK